MARGVQVGSFRGGGSQGQGDNVSISRALKMRTFYASSRGHCSPLITQGGIWLTPALPPTPLWTHLDMTKYILDIWPSLKVLKHHTNWSKESSFIEELRLQWKNKKKTIYLLLWPLTSELLRVYCPMPKTSPQYICLVHPQRNFK